MHQLEHVEAVEMSGGHIKLVGGQGAHTGELTDSPTLYVRVVFGHSHEVMHHYIVHRVAHSLYQVTLQAVVGDLVCNVKIV